MFNKKKIQNQFSLLFLNPELTQLLKNDAALSDLERKIQQLSNRRTELAPNRASERVNRDSVRAIDDQQYELQLKYNFRKSEIEKEFNADKKKSESDSANLGLTKNNIRIAFFSFISFVFLTGWTLYYTRKSTIIQEESHNLSKMRSDEGIEKVNLEINKLKAELGLVKAALDERGRTDMIELRFRSIEGHIKSLNANLKNK